MKNQISINGKTGPREKNYSRMHNTILFNMNLRTTNKFKNVISVISTETVVQFPGKANSNNLLDDLPKRQNGVC